MNTFGLNQDWKNLQSEMLTHLRNLIRIDTSNPPGNETPAAEYIARTFAAENIGSTILESAPGRGNIIARIKGDGSRRPLLLMSHLDVVGVEAEKWKYAPFSAEIAEGSVWGRGSLDCKNTVALCMMVMLVLKRSKLKPKRDIIFMAAADEETGGSHGAEWLTNNHFDLIDAEAALNEGGGFGMNFLGKTFYTFQSAEKGNVWVRLRAIGTPGHASIPRRDNPTLRVARIVSKLARRRFPLTPTKTVREMIDIMAATQKFPINAVIRQLTNPVLSEMIISLGIRDQTVAGGFRAMLKNTLTPTVLAAGHKVNVIPSEASAELDIRILPGSDAEQTFNEIRKAAGQTCIVEPMDIKPATESPTDHVLVDSIRKVIRDHDPASHVVPILIPGVTDGVFLRSRGVVVYGFTPLLPQEDISLTHGHNERISLESLEFSLKIGLNVVFDFVL